MLRKQSWIPSVTPKIWHGSAVAARLVGCVILCLLFGTHFATIGSVFANSPAVGTLTLQVDTFPPEVASITFQVEGEGQGESPTIVEFDVMDTSGVLHDLPEIRTGVWNIIATAANDGGETLYESHQRAVVRTNRRVVVAIKDWYPRHDSEHGIFLGHDLERTTLIDYATIFETTVVPEFADSTGLRPDERRAIFNIYGNEEAWALTTCAAHHGVRVLGCYSPILGQIFIAHWQTPDVTNGVLLGHEYMHWLAAEVGRINLPPWFNEGLADAETWRVSLGTDTWDNPRTEERWKQVVERAEPIPNLTVHSDLDPFLSTAIPYLLENYGGREALRTFFARAQEGVRFSDAFRIAFGLTVVEFQAAYQTHVIALRSGP